MLDSETPLMYGWTDQGFFILSELSARGGFGGVSSSCFRRFDEYEEIHIYKYKFIVSKSFFIDNKNTHRFISSLSSKSFNYATQLSKDKILRSNNLNFYIDGSYEWMSIDIAKEIPKSNENKEIDYYEIHGIKDLYIKLDGQIELKITIEKLVEQKIKFVLIDNSDEPDLNNLN